MLPAAPAPDPLAIFNALPGAFLLLSPAFIIEAASEEYLAAALLPRDRLVGRYLFEVFPDNPAAPQRTASATCAPRWPRYWPPAGPTRWPRSTTTCPTPLGLAFLEAYQQLALPPAQPPVVVVLTTSMNAPELARIQQLPIAGLLSKPLTREKVEHLLQQHFSA